MVVTDIMVIEALLLPEKAWGGVYLWDGKFSTVFLFQFIECKNRVSPKLFTRSEVRKHSLWGLINFLLVVFSKRKFKFQFWNGNPPKQVGQNLYRGYGG